MQVGTIASGRPYLVMPYYQKDSLEALIRKHGPLDWVETLSIGVKLAGALEAAHRVGLCIAMSNRETSCCPTMANRS